MCAADKLPCHLNYPYGGDLGEVGGGSFLLPIFKLKDLAEVNIDSSF